MRKYKQDLLFDLFQELFWNIKREKELFENKELTATIEAIAEELPQKQRIVFCSLIRCENSRDKAYKIFTERIEKIDMRGFQKNMLRARQKVAKLATDTAVVNNLRDTIFKN